MTALAVGVTAPRGFAASGVEAGLKQHGGRDLALVVNRGPRAASAGVFTSNRVVAAPVTLTRSHLAAGTLRAVVLNSGGANACTGRLGARDAQATAVRAAAALGLEPGQVGVCSTGLIGQRLPLDLLLPGIDQAAAALEEGDEAALAAADAIRTTDTVPKTAAVAGDGWSIGGMAKGAGMLAPGLATMLCVLTTDAVLDDAGAASALEEAVRTTFNRTDSDGCMSTNDSVILLSSGASGTAPDPAAFTEALREICARLARQLIADAEGATHDIAITVAGASDEAAAEAVARAVARSNLFKAAVFGNDPNWGRVVAEVGTVPVEVAPFDPSQLDVSINGVMVCRHEGVGEPRERVDMTAREVRVLVDLHAGEARATVWTNDLTHGYVHENSAYSS
ncbi:MAG: bifunctional glutamate N-acetyltransferase/amino-acid acetyltransferase ArgJ [Actinomyces sp.]|jgi:glutamate N-acetyltransferase/amino-acid N-acetyltransferase|nr:bifunctional glutamate N-acetyltransferase/amino-acid acetyltransferase ArgJ [Actinomyces sp.]MCI1642541.1 bifunctional glutamate N-acetyltransferase/amino-acid acetyltransferase ArgJ [Actinomyces sp.]MCI1663135.1 bifunctional glutamate N-acetyltransferase/amino-acid acetyltransferase ArgJ [Actinomyces sp.]MCI1691289.1 bifunctional glutamate N-acetyltransferase/amino-acid acetyltransferase ArgJ [Actinomyces sp.]MCI1787682.1 bifunctional glutamate N-acetyltransferase/amino-acid acetyltransfer